VKDAKSALVITDGKRLQVANQIRRPLSALGHLRDTQRKHRTSHRLPVLVLVQLPVQIKLKVHQLRGTQRHDDLALVRRRAHDRLALRHAPLVHAAVGEDVSDALRVYLQERVGADLLDGECRRGREEAGVLHFFNRFSDGEHQCTVDEGEDDV
jgi:hypothetical protein